MSASQQPPTAPPPLPDEWMACESIDGTQYYVHIPTDYTTWAFPSAQLQAQLRAQVLDAAPSLDAGLARGAEPREPVQAQQQTQQQQQQQQFQQTQQQFQQTQQQTQQAQQQTQQALAQQTQRAAPSEERVRTRARAPQHADEVMLSAEEIDQVPVPRGWKRFYDVDTQKPFFVESSTGVSTWEHPFVTKARQAARDLPLPLGWAVETDAHATAYYCHLPTSSSTWEHPNLRIALHSLLQDHYASATDDLARSLDVELERPAAPPSSVHDSDHATHSLFVSADERPTMNARSVDEAYATIMSEQQQQRSRGQLAMSRSQRQYKEYLRNLKDRARAEEANRLTSKLTSARASSRLYEPGMPDPDEPAPLAPTHARTLEEADAASVMSGDDEIEVEAEAATFDNLREAIWTAVQRARRRLYLPRVALSRSLGDSMLDLVTGKVPALALPELFVKAVTKRIVFENWDLADIVQSVAKNEFLMCSPSATQLDLHLGIAVHCDITVTSAVVTVMLGHAWRDETQLGIAHLRHRREQRLQKTGLPVRPLHWEQFDELVQEEVGWYREVNGKSTQWSATLKVHLLNADTSNPDNVTCEYLAGVNRCKIEVFDYRGDDIEEALVRVIDSGVVSIKEDNDTVSRLRLAVLRTPKFDPADESRTRVIHHILVCAQWRSKDLAMELPRPQAADYPIPSMRVNLDQNKAIEAFERRVAEEQDAAVYDRSGLVHEAPPSFSVAGDESGAAAPIARHSGNSSQVDLDSSASGPLHLDDLGSRVGPSDSYRRDGVPSRETQLDIQLQNEFDDLRRKMQLVESQLTQSRTHTASLLQSLSSSPEASSAPSHDAPPAFSFSPSHSSAQAQPTEATATATAAVPDDNVIDEFLGLIEPSPAAPSSSASRRSWIVDGPVDAGLADVLSGRTEPDAFSPTKWLDGPVAPDLAAVLSGRTSASNSQRGAPLQPARWLDGPVAPGLAAVLSGSAGQSPKRPSAASRDFSLPPVGASGAPLDAAGEEAAKYRAFSELDAGMASLRIEQLAFPSLPEILQAKRDVSELNYSNHVLLLQLKDLISRLPSLARQIASPSSANGAVHSSRTIPLEKDEGIQRIGVFNMTDEEKRLPASFAKHRVQVAQFVAQLQDEPAAVVALALYCPAQLRPALFAIVAHCLYGYFSLDERNMLQVLAGVAQQQLAAAHAGHAHEQLLQPGEPLFQLLGAFLEREDNRAFLVSLLTPLVTEVLALGDRDLFREFETSPLRGRTKLLELLDLLFVRLDNPRTVESLPPSFVFAMHQLSATDEQTPPTLPLHLFRVLFVDMFVSPALAFPELYGISSPLFPPSPTQRQNLQLLRRLFTIMAWYSRDEAARTVEFQLDPVASIVRAHFGDEHAARHDLLHEFRTRVLSREPPRIGPSVGVGQADGGEALVADADELAEAMRAEDGSVVRPLEARNVVAIAFSEVQLLQRLLNRMPRRSSLSPALRDATAALPDLQTHTVHGRDEDALVVLRVRPEQVNSWAPLVRNIEEQHQYARSLVSRAQQLLANPQLLRSMAADDVRHMVDALATQRPYIHTAQLHTYRLQRSAVRLAEFNERLSRRLNQLRSAVQRRGLARLAASSSSSAAQQSSASPQPRVRAAPLNSAATASAARTRSPQRRASSPASPAAQQQQAQAQARTSAASASSLLRRRRAQAAAVATASEATPSAAYDPAPLTPQPSVPSTPTSLISDAVLFDDASVRASMATTATAPSLASNPLAETLRRQREAREQRALHATQADVDELPPPPPPPPPASSSAPHSAAAPASSTESASPPQKVVQQNPLFNAIRRSSGASRASRSMTMPTGAARPSFSAEAAVAPT